MDIQTAAVVINSISIPSSIFWAVMWIRSTNKAVDDLRLGKVSKTDCEKQVEFDKSCHTKMSKDLVDGKNDFRAHGHIIDCPECRAETKGIVL